MSKKTIKILVTIIQLFLIASLFLPAGRTLGGGGKGDDSLSVFGMIHRYAGMGFSDDALLYTVLACIIPTAVIVTMFVLKERYNFGTATLLCAFYSLSSACFFSAASNRMVDDTALTYLPYMITGMSLVSMMLLIFAFLMSQPAGRKGADDTNSKESH